MDCQKWQMLIRMKSSRPKAETTKTSINCGSSGVIGHLLFDIGYLQLEKNDQMDCQKWPEMVFGTALLNCMGRGRDRASTIRKIEQWIAKNGRRCCFSSDYAFITVR